MILSIASGKGGTGKTLISTSLALSIQDSGDVQLLDCDVEEPNDHIFLNPQIIRKENVTVPVPKVQQEKCTGCGICAKVCAFHAILLTKTSVMLFKELCHSCSACSTLCPEHAISEENREIGTIDWGKSEEVSFVQGKLNLGEAKAPPVIKRVKKEIRPESIVIIDAPPGTSCSVVESIRGSDFCLLVTEPTPFGLNDLILAVEVVQQLEIPCGVVLNRVGVGDQNVEAYCQKENIPILLTIPLDTKIAHFYSRGITLSRAFPEWEKKFKELFEAICSLHRKYCDNKLEVRR